MDRRLRPSPAAVRGSSSCLLSVPATRARAMRLLSGFAGNGRRFCHGSGLLGFFWQALRGADFADLGKRWRCAAFRTESACKTAQKSRAAFAPPALRLARFDDSCTSAFSFVVQSACEQGWRCVQAFGANSMTLSVTMSPRKSSSASLIRPDGWDEQGDGGVFVMAGVPRRA